MHPSRSRRPPNRFRVVAEQPRLNDKGVHIHLKRPLLFLLLVAAIVTGTTGVVSAAERTSSSSLEPARPAHSHASHVSPASDLRVTLDRLLGEHAALAMNATNLGYSGSKSFPAVAKSLDRNSVELSKAIASVYGKQAGNVFLNGKFQWRDHIEFFVDYTVAKAKNDRAGQQRAVRNLTVYIATFSSFLSEATGLPLPAVRASITEHVMQLKGQLDAFASGNYARSYAITRAAYAHMFMTGDTLAGAIVKKFPQKFGS